MDGLELAVVLGATLIVGGFIAKLLRVTAPLVLLALGAGLGFLPFLGTVQLPPDVVLLLFLPALLYWESLNTSLREIRKNIRVISLLAVPLVFATAAIVAVVAHAFGLPWSISIALGAILAPTDATAVSSVAGRLPRRAMITLRAESLVNDGTALVLYAVAVAAAVSERPISAGETVLGFVGSYAIGIAIGIAVGFVVVGARRFLRDRLLENTLSILTPFLAYLPAELLHVSGVVAVVTCGLVLSRFGPQIISASTRSQGFGFWQIASYVLNGTLFVLIGFQLHLVLEAIGNSWQLTLALGLLCSVAVVVVRIAWSYTTPYLIRALDRRPAQRLLRQTARQRFPLAWAGFRGAVSLAAALALPTLTAGGEPLEGRGLVIAVTLIVILFTLVVQGLTMNAVVRWAKLPPDPTEFDEELLAEQVTLTAALAALPEVAELLRSPAEAQDALRRNYEERLGRIHRDERDPRAARRDETEQDHEGALLLELLPVKREALFQLRNQGRIDDIVLRRIQARIDSEELRLRSVIDD
jgi:Na+/H+ antiporter